MLAALRPFAVAARSEIMRHALDYRGGNDLEPIEVSWTLLVGYLHAADRAEDAAATQLAFDVK